MKRKWSLKTVALLSFVAAVIVCLGFAGHVLNLHAEEYEGIMAWIKDSNIHFYFLMLLLFAVTFLGSRIVFIFLKPTEDETGRIYDLSFRKQSVMVAMPVIFVFAFLLHWFCMEQYTEFPYSAAARPLLLIPVGMAVSVIVGGILMAFYMTVKKRDISDFSLYLVYVICLILCFYSLYYVNIFKADFHHGIAVLESIYNVCDLVPFTQATTGIYGHYGLFFILPMRMSHGSPYMAAWLLAFSGCIMTAASFYVFHSYLPKNWLRAMMACASIFVIAVFRGGNYWQVHPIRDMFPALLCAYICMLQNKKKEIQHTKWIWMGYLLVSLAVLWNTESGLFCLVAFSAYRIVQQLQEYPWYKKRMILLYIRVILSGVGCVLAGIGYVNAYNLFCGGKLIFRAFFFPLFTESYMDGIIRYDMQWGNHAWIYVFVLFAAVMAWGIYHTRLFKRAGAVMCKDAPAAVVISMLGLLSFSYYVNRAAYANLTVCYCYALFANALVIKETWAAFDRWNRQVRLEELGRKASAVIAIAIVTILGVQLPLSSMRLADYHSSEVCSTEGIEEELSALEQSIPQNTYGVGKGISVLYHMLDWDNYAHVRDFSDFWIGGDAAADEVIEEVRQQDGFLMSGNDVSLLTRLFAIDPFYSLVGTYRIQEHDFYYYQKSQVKMTNYLIRHVSFSEANENTTAEAAYVNPNQSLTSSRLFLKPGEYTINVTVSGAVNLQLSYNKGAVVLMQQSLNAGENQVFFSLPEGVRDLVFQVDNIEQQEVILTQLYMEMKNIPKGEENE